MILKVCCLILLHNCFVHLFNRMYLIVSYLISIPHLVYSLMSISCISFLWVYSFCSVFSSFFFVHHLNNTSFSVSSTIYLFWNPEISFLLQTHASKSGGFRYDIHYWIGKDASEVSFYTRCFIFIVSWHKFLKTCNSISYFWLQDEAHIAAIKTLELDAALGGRAVQYRELQGHETERFLSCFRPCIIPEETEPQEHKTRMFLCKGKHVVHVQEVPCARSSLNHDSVCILDNKNKIFQFNGSNTSIQERAKALEVVQYIRDTYHRSKCDIATIGKSILY